MLLANKPQHLKILSVDTCLNQGVSSFSKSAVRHTKESAQILTKLSGELIPD
ncbi:1166_t:CDS:2 [Scutellospora calospora]|uniref:1166_t:CDS:1 n=1 Tax=Scutellospora calospora TaxID=85575 RepID=A0ACA9L4W0_9GLOM|nr:1166_t:CDS:2 [Scutellospora calospora]